MIQIYLSVFEARQNYKVHRLSRDFEVLLCPDWIRFAQSDSAISRQNMSLELKLNSICSVSEASHFGYNKFSSVVSGLRTIETMLILYIRLLCFFVVCMRHNKKERKKERSLMSDNKEALWTCLIIIYQYHKFTTNEEESAMVLSLKEWKLVNRQMMIGENVTAHKNLYISDNIMKHY